MSCDINKDRHFRSFISLLPRGKAWEAVLTPGSVMRGFFKSLSDCFAEVRNIACRMKSEFFYSSLVDTRDLWLTEYRLPDACDPEGTTLPLRIRGVDVTKKIPDLVVDALSIIGITAEVTDEKVNGKARTLSVFIKNTSEIFGDCLRYASGKVSLEGAPENTASSDDSSFAYYADNGSGVPPEELVADNGDSLLPGPLCPYYPGTVDPCDDVDLLYASPRIQSFIPNLECVVDQFVPLWLRVDFYFENYSTPIKF